MKQGAANFVLSWCKDFPSAKPRVHRRLYFTVSLASVTSLHFLQRISDGHVAFSEAWNSSHPLTDVAKSDLSHCLAGSPHGKVIQCPSSPRLLLSTIFNFVKATSILHSFRDNVSYNSTRVLSPRVPLRLSRDQTAHHCDLLHSARNPLPGVKNIFSKPQQNQDRMGRYHNLASFGNVFDIEHSGYWYALSRIVLC